MLNKLLVFLALLLIVFGTHQYDKQKGIRKAVEATKSQMAMEYQAKAAKAAKVALMTQESLQASADKEREEKNETINRITDERDAAIVRLRNRPSRPSIPTVAQDTHPIQACTARELYREDGEFLTREAARAQSVLAERNYYYSQYEIIRKKLNGIDFTN